jgi:nucleoside 2-deoxyribosyltransferase
MKIYIAGSISGQSPDEVECYFSGTKWMFENWGYTVFHPMIGKGQLRTEKIYRAKDYRHPVATNRAIVGRDRWMVEQADVIFMDLSSSTHASIGCMFELAWANEFNKHVVLVLPENNIHQHAFVLQAADIIFENESEALSYLKSLIKDIER